LSYVIVFFASVQYIGSRINQGVAFKPVNIGEFAGMKNWKQEK